jgi:hypothetical protein
VRAGLTVMALVNDHEVGLDRVLFPALRGERLNGRDDNGCVRITDVVVRLDDADVRDAGVDQFGDCLAEQLEQRNNNEDAVCFRASKPSELAHDDGLAGAGRKLHHNGPAASRVLLAG